MPSPTESSVHLSQSYNRQHEDPMSMTMDPTGPNTTEVRIWDGMAYRHLPYLPKSREEVHNNLISALSSPAIKDIFQILKQIQIGTQPSGS